MEKKLTCPFVEVRSDICPFCKSQKIELFSFNGYPQNYKKAVEEHLRGNQVEFNKYEIRAMKCRSCNKEFVIDWSYGFPRPLKITAKFNGFISEFLQGI